MVADDRDYVRVELNVGREHGRKSADIRGLLADLAGLKGRSVRDLTVADRVSYFRMPRELLTTAAGRLHGAREGSAALQLVEAPDATVTLRADPIAVLQSDEAARGAFTAATSESADPHLSTVPSSASAAARPLAAAQMDLADLLGGGPDGASAPSPSDGTVDQRAEASMPPAVLPTGAPGADAEADAGADTVPTDDAAPTEGAP
jgi:hypothetical protein